MWTKEIEGASQEGRLSTIQPFNIATSWSASWDRHQEARRMWREVMWWPHVALVSSAPHRSRRGGRDPVRRPQGVVAPLIDHGDASLASRRPSSRMALLSSNRPCVAESPIHAVPPGLLERDHPDAGTPGSANGRSGAGRVGRAAHDLQASGEEVVHVAARGEGDEGASGLRRPGRCWPAAALMVASVSRIAACMAT